MMIVEAKQNSSFIGVGQISHNVCDKIIDRFYKDPNRSAGKAGGTIRKEVKISTDSSFMINEEPQYRDELTSIINEYIQYYNPHLTDGLDKYGFVERTNIQKYEPGEGFLKWHYERSGVELTNRVLVFMTYLNDVPDGGTEFKFQGITTEAKKGLTVVWPADWTHVHRGVVSSTTTKYITTGWLSWIPQE